MTRYHSEAAKRVARKRHDTVGFQKAKFWKIKYRKLNLLNSAAHALHSEEEDGNLFEDRFLLLELAETVLKKKGLVGSASKKPKQIVQL